MDQKQKDEIVKTVTEALRVRRERQQAEEQRRQQLERDRELRAQAERDRQRRREEQARARAVVRARQAQRRNEELRAYLDFKKNGIKYLSSDEDDWFYWQVRYSFVNEVNYFF